MDGYGWPQLGARKSRPGEGKAALGKSQIWCLQGVVWVFNGSRRVSYCCSIVLCSVSYGCPVAFLGCPVVFHLLFSGVLQILIAQRTHDMHRLPYTKYQRCIARISRYRTEPLDWVIQNKLKALAICNDFRECVGTETLNNHKAWYWMTCTIDMVPDIFQEYSIWATSIGNLGKTSPGTTQTSW